MNIHISRCLLIKLAATLRQHANNWSISWCFTLRHNSAIHDFRLRCFRSWLKPQSDVPDMMTVDYRPRPSFLSFSNAKLLELWTNYMYVELCIQWNLPMDVATGWFSWASNATNTKNFAIVRRKVYMTAECCMRLMLLMIMSKELLPDHQLCIW